MGFIKVKITGKFEKSFRKGIVVGDVLNKVFKDKKRIPIAVKVSGILVDLNTALLEDSQINPIFVDSPEGEDILRHSTSHIMAQAVLHLFPETKCATGPVVKNGFYYDFDPSVPFSSEDLENIEEEMKEIVKADIPFIKIRRKKEEAIDYFKDRGEQYKVELINEIQNEYVTMYQQGDFVDLCRGPHIPSTKFAKNFRLLNVAGAYWHGDERREMLQRIYGTVFATEERLKEYLLKLEEAKKRDHRILGKELELFSFFNEAHGFPFYQPKGLIIWNHLVELSREEQNKRGYEEVSCPLVLSESLWKQSGHYEHYKKNMYFTKIDEFPYAIKPMNCPGHALYFKSQMRSYRELPKRISEMGLVHRHERSGVLHGLFRVRSFTQDDAHIFLKEDQIQDEIVNIINLAEEIYKIFNFGYKIELSTKPEDAMGNPGFWQKAEKDLESTLKRIGVEYEVRPGEGAFYGPKIDFHIEDSLGRSWQCGTIQLDFFIPENFELEYIGKDNKSHRPIMIHRAIMGSIERFMGIILEHFAGALPVWISPVQVAIIPVAERHIEYAKKIEYKTKELSIRCIRDVRRETVSKKIRDAEGQKIPYMFVVGDEEVKNNSVSIRQRTKGDVSRKSIDSILKQITKEIREKVCYSPKIRPNKYGF